MSLRSSKCLLLVTLKCYFFIKEKGATDSSEKLSVDYEKLQKYISQQRYLNDYTYSETFKSPVLIQVTIVNCADNALRQHFFFCFFLTQCSDV